MDFSKFSETDFDLKEWINGAFRTQKESNQNPEQFSATLITKLQVFIQEINNTVDETSQQTIQNFPRILREIEVLKQESYMLKEQMKSARDDIVKVEKSTVESMKMLLDLDNMKTNMTTASKALQEADNWTTLTSDLEIIFESKDIEKITNRIQGMQQCLKILQDDSPDYLNRCLLLENFKNKFETILSADIVASFNSKSIDLAKNYVNVFEKIDRLPELKKYYYQCQKCKVLDKLNQILTNQDDIKKLLKQWLDFVIELWHNEIQWCKQVFDDTYLIVIHLLNECFIEFNRKFLTQLDVIVDKDQKCLDILVTLKEDTDRFFLTINSNLDYSIKNEQVISDKLNKLLHCIYEPYKKHIKQYTKLETQRLQAELDAIKLDHNDILECVQLLNLSVSKIINNGQAAIDRCMKFTFGCGIHMLIEALRTYLKAYMNEYKRVTTNLKERNIKVMTENEEWDLFRHFLKIIQIFGEFILQYEQQLEGNLLKQISTTFITSVPHQRSANDSEPSTPTQRRQRTSSTNQDITQLTGYYCRDFLLDDTDRSKLNSLISNIVAGEDYNLIPDVKKAIFSVSEHIHRFGFEIVFAPIKFLLHGLSKSNIWSSNDQNSTSSTSVVNQHSLPLFSLTPQEYITKIGQYLLTLPQNFEPFTMQDSAQLIIALKNGKLPYLEEQDLSNHITACWLDSISNGTVNVFCDEILKIQQITLNSVRQLIIDIEYVCNVFEDVGLKDYQNLQHILDLLRATKDDFQEISKNKPARIVSAIRNMRGF